ncbi:MAG TPA: glycosyltransferase family 87 protein, partial [Gaiellaceae bacterium]|nr:glycosyltransferase family 87 protein [Gaiellaceae bacterium]
MPKQVRAVPVEGGARARASGIWAAGRRSLDWVALGVLLLIVFWWWLVLAVQGSPGDWAFDFRQFWQGGNDVVNGVSPYPSEALLATAGDHLDPEGIRDVFRFPYPAVAAIALAPFGALGFEVAAAIWSALLIVSLLAAGLTLGVRDWRVLGIVVSSAPVISAVRLGTLTPLMILLLAVAWRWRDRRWVAGGSIAFAISLKLFLWPVVVWLAATRRFTAAIVAAGVAAAVTLAAWAAIGFDGLAEYPELLRRLSDVVADRGFSLVAFGVEVGLPRGVAETLPWLVGVSLLAVVVAGARRRDGDRVGFSVAIVASIALTPIVWLHYFALLVVPLALARPRISWAWGMMWIFWVMPAQENQGDLWRLLVAVLVVGAALV